MADGRATPDEQAELLIALLKALSVPRVGVLSWSAGGPCGYRLAAAHPDRVSALVAFAALSGHYDWTIGRSDRLLFGTQAGRFVLDGMMRLAPARVVSGTLTSTGDVTADGASARTSQIMADPARVDFLLTLTRRCRRRTASARTSRSRGPDC